MDLSLFSRNNHFLLIFSKSFCLEVNVSEPSFENKLNEFRNIDKNINLINLIYSKQNELDSL